MVDVTESTFPWKARNRRNEHLYLLDGDEWCLTPGRDFQGTIAAFRTKMSRLCKARGITYRSQVDEHGRLWFEAYRDKPGDLFTDEDAAQAV
jgi:hypothetical protein